MSKKVAQIRPLIVGLEVPKPTVSMAYAITPTPLAVGVTIPTPFVPTFATPLTVTVTIVTPTVV